MRSILLWLIGGVTTALVVGLGLAALVPWGLRRRNAVHPRAHADAPLWWLVSPGGLARLHRRLRRLVRRSRGLDTRGDERSRLRVEALHLEAVRLDADLVSARDLPVGARRPRTEVLAGRTRTLEASARRLEASLRRPLLVLPGGREDPGPGERLEAEAGARGVLHEVVDLDRLDKAPASPDGPAGPSEAGPASATAASVDRSRR